MEGWNRILSFWDGLFSTHWSDQKNIQPTINNLDFGQFFNTFGQQHINTVNFFDLIWQAHVAHILRKIGSKFFIGSVPQCQCFLNPFCRHNLKILYKVIEGPMV